MASEGKASKEEQEMLAEKLNAALDAAAEVVADLNEAFKERNGRAVTPEQPPSSCSTSDRSK